MEESLKCKIKQMRQMLVTLEAAIEAYKKQLRTVKPEEHNEDLDLIMSRDSLIKRLEYSVDSFWKTLKVYIDRELEAPIDQYGPKAIVRSAVLYGVINEEESAAIIEMIHDRNKTSHIYDEEIVDEIAKRSPDAFKTMDIVLKRLEKEVERVG